VLEKGRGTVEVAPSHCAAWESWLGADQVCGPVKRLGPESYVRVGLHWVAGFEIAEFLDLTVSESGFWLEWRDMGGVLGRGF
jgi:hypothetical protein